MVCRSASDCVWMCGLLCMSEVVGYGVWGWCSGRNVVSVGVEWYRAVVWCSMGGDEVM